MTVEIRNPQGQPLTVADRSQAVAESLRQLARASRFADRKKGIRSYQSHVKSDPLTPLLFALLCLLPSLAGAIYFGLIASDRYVTEARFAVRPAIGGAEKASSDEVGTGNGVPKGLLAQDTLITRNFIDSRPLVEIIEGQMPLRAMFSRDSIDWFSRFDADKPIEKLVKYWNKRVKTEIEQSSGIITLTVEAFEPQESLTIARAIMKEAEAKVNLLSLQLREDGLAESKRELVRAEERLTKVRLAMRDLRNREGLLDAGKTNETNLKVMAELRKSRIELQVQLALSQRDLAPESRRILDMKAQIKNLDDNIEQIERQTTSLDPARRRVLSDAAGAFENLTNEQQDAEKYFSKVLAANERARIVAARQIEFFSPVVEPVLAQSAEQPRRLLMASLVAAGSLAVFALSVIFRRYSA